jgi:cytochrome c oxidase cbb3-type subunit III
MSHDTTPHNDADNHHEEHNFDGITELNNAAPTWIVILFLVTIGFSGIYAIRYFGYPGADNNQAREYEKRSEAHNQKYAVANAGNGGDFDFMLPENLQAGAAIYTEKGCIACHGTQGEGNAIGPNLTDNAWIHGCSPAEVAAIIANGVPEKGMTPYKAMLSEKQINQLTGYILNNLVGSEPANGKEPQGTDCQPAL